MTTVVGVRFKRTGKVYYFDPAVLEIALGDGVIVETARGIEYGDVVMAPTEVEDSELVSPLKPVIRVATAADKKQVAENIAKEKDAFAVGETCVAEHQLEMKLVDVEYTFDGKKIIFYFTADGRVDFRELVRDLASRFHNRIELRQIGVRDEAKMLGGLGPCGRAICCKTFMHDFVPVSIRMAKEQNISLNPTKISGLCGRLMCCLQFESEFYASARNTMPRNGTNVMTPDGPGDVTDQHILKQTVKVRVVLQDMTVDQREYKLEDIRIITAEEREEAIAKLESSQKAFEESRRREAEKQAAARARAEERMQATRKSRQQQKANRVESIEAHEKLEEERQRNGRHRLHMQSAKAGSGRSVEQSGKPTSDTAASDGRTGRRQHTSMQKARPDTESRAKSEKGEGENTPVRSHRRRRPRSHRGGHHEHTDTKSE